MKKIIKGEGFETIDEKIGTSLGKRINYEYISIKGLF